MISAGLFCASWFALYNPPFELKLPFCRPLWASGRPLCASGRSLCASGRSHFAVVWICRLWRRPGKSGLVPSEQVPTPSLPRLRRAPLVCAGANASRSLPLSATIDLHEIHLARQSSLQVPVGHIPVPGGIKLCSPGTFLVANYLIINNGPSQVNFTKPKRATIRYTNSVGSCRWDC